MYVQGEEMWLCWSTLAGAACSSYAAELTAMSEAVNWLAGAGEEWTTAAVVTDSRSLLDALRGDGGEPEP